MGFFSYFSDLVFAISPIENRTHYADDGPGNICGWLRNGFARNVGKVDVGVACEGDNGTCEYE